MKSLQEPYIRSRESPFFKGLLRNDNPSKNHTSTTNSKGKDRTKNFSRTTSEINQATSKNIVQAVSEKSLDLPLQDSDSSTLYPIPEFGNSSMISKDNPLALPSFPSDAYDSAKESSPSEATEQCDILDIGNCLNAIEAVEEYKIVATRATTEKSEKSFSLKRRKQDLSNIPLPQSAASFYNGFSPQVEIVESGESIRRINLYLSARRDDVYSGVPGKFLHAVIAQDISDVGSVVSTIMYAFYLNETMSNEQLCTVPVINMKRADLISHTELKWLLDSSQINEASLIFIDEIDLSYYDLFGSLKLVLINGNKLSAKQEALKGAIVEIFNCKKDDSVYPGVQNVIVGEDSSSCTLIAEKFALTSPEVLAEQGFCRLLLAGILIDSANLSSPHCTIKDKYMATLLINGAGRFGSTGLYKLLRYKMYDVSNFKVVDILRKDFKKWTSIGKLESTSSRSLVSYIGMSSIRISIEQLLSHQDNTIEEIKYFQQLERLRLLLVVSGYYDSHKNFKRELLISAGSVELMKNLLIFLNSNASHLPLIVIHQPGLKDDMRIFEIDKITSRKTIERLLEEFGGPL